MLYIWQDIFQINFSYVEVLIEQNTQALPNWDAQHIVITKLFSNISVYYLLAVLSF